MKSFYGDTATSENCSCTSYYYSSESDSLTIRRLIERRSRINRLFRENYLPSNDIKLLDKLVRTRAVYDDIRKQLLSGSNISVNEKAVLKPVKFTSAKGKELREAEKNSDIFAMIDLVDKGIACGSRKLSQCCSCCSCGSKARCYMHAPKSRRRKCPYKSGYSNTKSSDVSNKTITKEGRFKTKSIKSEPCTCTTKSYESIKRRSRNFGQQPFLGYFPINEHELHTNKASVSNSKLPEANLTKTGELPVKKLPQSRSCYRKKSQIQEHKQKVHTLDKDKTSIKKSICNDVSGMLLKNIAKEYSMYIKKLPTETIKNTNLRNKSRARNAVDNPFPTVSTKGCVKRGFNEEKIKCLQSTDNMFKTDSAVDNILIKDPLDNNITTENDQPTQFSNKLWNITRHPNVVYRSTSNQKQIDDMNSSRNIGYHVTLTKNCESAGRKQIRNKHLTNTTCQRGLCATKNYKKKYNSKTFVLFSQDIISRILSHNLRTRSASAPNISLSTAGPSTKLFKNTSKESLQIKNRRDFPVLLEENRTAPSQVLTKFAIDIKHYQNPLKMSPSSNVHPSNLKRVGKKSQLVAKNTKKEHRVNYKETFNPRKISSFTVKSGHTLRKHKLRQCLYKLKLVKSEKKKPKLITISKGAHNIQILSSQSNLRSSSSACKEMSRTKLLRSNYKICNGKCSTNSVYSLNSSSVSQSTIRPLQSSLLSKNRDTSLKYLRTKSLCNAKKPSLSFDHKYSQSQIFIDHNNIFKRHEASNIAVGSNINLENKSITCIVQKNNQQRKLVLLKKEKKAKGLMLGTVVKRCFCTLKLHKQGRNKNNHDIVNFDTKNKEKNRSEERCSKKYSLKTLKALNETAVLTAICDLAKQNDISETMQVKSPLKKTAIASKNYKMLKRSQDKLKEFNENSQVTSKIKSCCCTLQSLKNNYQHISNKLYENKNSTALQQRTSVTYANYNVIFPQISLPYKAQYQKMASQKIVRFKSQFSLEFDNLKNFNLAKDKNEDFHRALAEGSHPMNRSHAFWENSSHAAKADNSSSKCTGISQFLRKCYCTMNVQIANRGKSHRNKLKPYECEPGICVPGECDPIECQKLIMKRLMKQSSTMSETKTLRSSSSSTEGFGLRNKRHQYSAEPESKRIEKKHITYTSPRREPLQASEKQVVRVGSTFKFDIEFFKDTKSGIPIKNEHRPSMSSKSSRTGYRKLRTEGTKGRGIKKRDIESQSVKMRDRSSSVAPMMKRCFCTLKLQKRGRIDPRAINVSQGTSTPMKIKIEPVAMEASQNTKPLKPTKLLPYECEPGICIPGECDPYACLDLINKRLKKSRGTNSTRSNLTSSSSMTRNRRMRTKGKQAQSRVIYSKPVRSTAAVVKPNRETIRPSRQAVRIGSSFSFDIEFYKDQFPSSDQIAMAAKTVNLARHKSHEVESGVVTKDKALDGKSIDSYSRDSQAVPNKRDRGMGVGPILKRCFCTLKLQKPKETTKLKTKETPCVCESTATPAIKQTPDFYTRSTMVNKPPVHKLLPYECEPGVCVPGSCDPYECEKRIKRRLMNRGSGTRQRGTRSVSSSVRRGKKLRDSHVQFAGKQKKIYNHIAERKPEPKKSFETAVSKPSRQAVKIGSTFSFDIEFYKNSGNTGRLPQTPVQQTAKKVASSVTNRYPTSTNKKVQENTSTRNTDSQIIAKKMRSTMTGVKPFLKRCFCTLQLQKHENTRKPVEHKVVSTKTHKYIDKSKIEAAEKGTGTKVCPIQCTKLEPYECEPGTCTPGECDPYECLKRIKRRELRNKQSGTDRPKGRSVSSLVSGSTKYRTKKAQAFTNTKKIRTESQARHASKEHRQRQRLTHSSNPPRQAVRIGSCFSFNVEFYKDSSPQAPCSPICPPECKQPVCKPTCREECKATEAKLQNMRTLSTYSRGVNIRHNETQSKDMKMESKGSGMKPALKRCFCTLKLQKIGNKQQNIKKVDFAPNHIGTSTPITKRAEILANAAKEVGTVTKREKVTHKLEPYECEPGYCVPGQCDPYECLKRIKERKMRNLGTETKSPRKRTMSSFTYQNRKLKSTKTQNHMENPQREIKATYKQVTEQPPRPNPAVENINRQAVRIGSNFSFNIEFFKDANGLSSPTSHYVHVKPEKSKSTSSIYTGNAIKTKNRGLHYENYGHHKKSQVARVQTESRGSGMGPLLKRCFCTLTLQKPPTYERHKEQTNLKKPALVVTENKTTSTKKKYIPPIKQMHLEPYECEPGICIPGECDPYECLERIKKRGTARKSQTDKCKYNCKGLQHNGNPFKVNRQNEAMIAPLNKTTTIPSKETMIVEQPRFPLLLEGNNKQAVKISSNFSFNIEFYKDIAHQYPMTPKRLLRTATDNLCKVKQTECSKKVNKCEKQCGYCDNSRSCQSQSDSPKTENKSSGVGKLLKRCFCTAKLNQQIIPPHHRGALTVGRVETIRPTFPFTQQNYWVQYQTQQSIKPKKKDKINIKRDTLCNQCQDPKTTSKSKVSTEMKTILPYSPSKFKKKISKSVIPNNITSDEGCTPTTCTERGMLQDTKKANLRGAKRLTEKKSKSAIVNERAGLSVQNSAIKNFVCRCMKLFSKSKNQTKNDQNSTNCSPICENKPLGQLNTSKSERHRKADSTNTKTKKSKSLKITRTNQNLMDVNKKTKFSKYQSGDGGQINNARKIDCPRCEAQVSQTNKIKQRTSNRVRFSLTAESKNKSGNVSKSIFKKASKVKNTNNITCIAMCPCCGGFKINKVASTPEPNTNVKSCRCVGNCLCPKLKPAGKSTSKCVCGNRECSEEAKKLRRKPKQVKSKPSEPCVCGSMICDSLKKESKRRKSALEHSQTKSRKKELAKKKLLLRKKEKELASKKQREDSEKEKELIAENKHKAFLERQNRYKKEDEARRKRRMREDKRMLEEVGKYKNAGDCSLITESVLDVAKLGFVSAGDILRCAGKAAIDPKFTYDNIKTTVTDPSRAWTKLKSSADDSPGIATLKRLKLRLKETSCVKVGKEKLELNPLTHYCVHMCDKDPKKRMRNTKKQKVDFQCSPYMLSLRKRPHLSVYLCCPWFYPHCISLLNLWKQFTDIILFLLAVTVWSPCILCMEACRALMCCFLCTG